MIEAAALGWLMAASLQQEAPLPPAQVSAELAVATINGACLPLAAGVVPVPEVGHTSRRRAFLAEHGFSEIIPPGAWDRLGSARIGMADADVVGHRRVGRDDLFLAIGGSRVASCRVAIASPSRELADGTELVAAISGSGLCQRTTAGTDHGPMRIWHYMHRLEQAQPVELAVVTGRRNEVRNQIVLIATPARNAHGIAESN